MFEVSPQQRKRKSVYEEWVATQGVPLVQGHYIADLSSAPVESWVRRNAAGCFINHDASNTSNDCYLLELAAAHETPPQHGLYEEMIYVLKGRGATTVWYDESRKSSFEWAAGSLFAIPMNAWHQHFNASGSEPVRYIGVTSAPIAINLYGDPEFIFNCNYHFVNRFSGEADYFSGDGQLTGRVWETNFVADVPGYELLAYPERGAGGRNIKFTLARNQMGAHVSEFPIGTYKKAHRHGPGAHVIVLNGDGYSLMWKEGEAIRRFDWQPGTLVIPPDRTFHQHFNIGASPARYLALRFSGNEESKDINSDRVSSRDVRLGGDQIEYDDQDPLVHRTFVEEAARHGVDVNMDEFLAAPSR
jgi:oxalate decarboxylase/phosphoglucose isomerase-like protein (cupin superfamily)